MRCYLEPERWGASPAELSPGETHYLLHVLRRRQGDTVSLFDGQGRVAEAVITGSKRHRAEVEILGEETLPPPVPRIELLQAVPKGKRMDLILEKSVELGATAIRPLITEHTVVKLDADRVQTRAARWREIVLSAARQCGAAWLPEVHPPSPLADVLENREALPECVLLCDLEAERGSLRRVLGQAREAGCESIGVLVGPEGDFTAGEKALALEQGGQAVHLGESVLRTDTAAIFALGAVRYEWL